jgi:nitrous oxidase accessory protein NosD
MFKNIRASADDLLVKRTVLRGVSCLCVGVVAALSAPAASADAATLLVDKDGQQCQNADYRTIAAAVADADPGDKIEVCPDLYTESVVVNTPDVKLTATQRPEQDCDDPTPAPADSTQQAIVIGPGNTFAFDLQADDITLRGFVVQQSGLRTGQNFSGYRVEHNLVQDNRGTGAAFGSSGERLSRLSHNCFRRNGTGQTGGAVFSIGMFGTELRGARIDHNSFYANNFAIRLSGGEDVRVAHNRSWLDGVFIRPGLTRSVEITHNRIGPGSGPAIWFFSSPVGPQPNTSAEVSHNVIEGRGAHGILADPGSLIGSLISHNALSVNALDGINLQAGNTGNRVEHIRADANGSDGIHAQGATGNVFVKNRMSGNAEHDAHDDNRAANQWTNNRCRTDSPAGSICAR